MERPLVCRGTRCETRKASWEQKAAPCTGDAVLWFWGPPDSRVTLVTCELGGELAWGRCGRLPADHLPILQSCHPPLSRGFPRSGIALRPVSSWLPERLLLADINSYISN